MTTSSQPPTLASLAEQLAGLHERMDHQQREIDDLRRENVRLRARVVEKPSLDTNQPVARWSEPASALPDSTADERISRRRVLRRAASVAAGAVAVGVVLDQQSQEAGASHTSEMIDVDSVAAHYILIIAADGSDGIFAQANTSTESYAGVWGDNRGSGPGVTGQSETGIGVIGKGLIGVKGLSNSAGYGANYGLHTDNGYGVVGDGHGAATSGVLGRNPTGDGVRGEGKNGLRGTATSRVGYGGIFTSTRAQIRLTPTVRTGRPTTGAHAVGELYLDKVGGLYICTVAGTPGTWRKVSTVVA